MYICFPIHYAHYSIVCLHYEGKKVRDLKINQVDIYEDTNSLTTTH